MSYLPIGFLEFGLKDAFETLIIALVLSYLYRLIRGSFAVPAFIGIVLIFAVNAFVSVFNLTTISFLLRSVLDVGILAVFIIFQPEIRRLLYNIGQNTSLDRIFGKNVQSGVIDEIVIAAKNLSRKKIGALMVFANNVNVSELTNNGIKIDSTLTHQLLETLFQKDTPLHDGAVIIKNDRVVAAGCILPISYNQNLASNFGTRHRAALGITEATNVFVVVVSEETGQISVAEKGILKSRITIQELRTNLEEALGRPDSSAPDLWFSTKPAT